MAWRPQSSPARTPIPQENEKTLTPPPTDGPDYYTMQDNGGACRASIPLKRSVAPVLASRLGFAAWLRGLASRLGRASPTTIPRKVGLLWRDGRRRVSSLAPELTTGA